MAVGAMNRAGGKSKPPRGRQLVTLHGLHGGPQTAGFADRTTPGVAQGGDFLQDPHGQLFDLGEGPGGAKSRRHRWSGGKPGFDSAIDFSMCRRLECHQGILRKMGKVI